MSWPPAYTASFIGSGATTIKWGTDGIINVGNIGVGNSGGVFGAYTVVSCRPSDEIDTQYIEQGSGLKATRIMLWQGRRITFTVVDDTGFTPPSPNSQIQALDPLSGSLLTFRVVDNGSTASRKTEAQREITAEYLTMIEGANTVPPA